MKIRCILAFLIASLVLSPSSLCQDDTTKAAPGPIYLVGRGVKPPRAIYSPEPEYPTKARKEHQQGDVVLWMVVEADGLPRDMKVVRSLGPEFDEAAKDAVKSWKFAPATKDDEPVAVAINVKVSFHLR